ncbi:MAG: leucine-rich repeat domain-containing protein [Clostridia bacterium]|nr:leucine-rich repeat domain-containing protein [Clostridia bacterium]
MKQKIKLGIIFGVEFIAVIVILLLVFFAGKKTYTVTFDLNGGTLLSGDLVQSIVQGGNATPPVAAKDGCYLHSWSASYKQVTKDLVIRAVWEYETTEGIEYESAPESNYCVISGCFKDLYGDVYIGAYHDGKKVLGIKEGAFENCGSIKNIYMLDGIISIGKGAFSGCTSLESIALPGTLTNIGESAFYGCEGLVSVTLPETLEKIGTGAFIGCTSLSEVIFNGNLLSIDKGAFEGCVSLKEITLPESLVSIGYGAFDQADIVINIPIDEADKPVGWSHGWCAEGAVLNWGYEPEDENSDSENSDSENSDDSDGTGKDTD